MQTPIIFPKDLKNLSAENKNILNLIPGNALKGELAPINVLGTLLHGKNVLGDFLTYWINAKNNMSLSCREQEIIILRMGFHYQSEYVWKHHIPVAIEFKINESEIESLTKNKIDTNDFIKKELALIEFCDEMVINRNVSDELWLKHKNEISSENVLDLIHLISQYVVFALTNNVFRVQLEDNLKPFRTFN